MSASDYYAFRSDVGNHHLGQGYYDHRAGLDEGTEEHMNPDPLSNYSSFRRTPAPYDPPHHHDPYTPLDPYAPDYEPYSTASPYAVDTKYPGADLGHTPSPGPVPEYADDIPLRTAPGPPGGMAPPSPAWAAPPPEPLIPPPMASPMVQPRGLRRFFGKKIPWFVYLVTVIQVAVFIGQLVVNGMFMFSEFVLATDIPGKLTGSPIQVKPQVNPMLGPSGYVRIHMGTRFVPCMKNVKGVEGSDAITNWGCPNATSSNIESSAYRCSLSELCGFGGVPNPKPHGSLDDKPEPNQWFRFIIPMFMHAGFIHIGFNLLGQLTMGADIERLIGSVRFGIIYLASGIFGFVLGGNFAPAMIDSCGASGALFGINAIALLDLFYSWHTRRNPVCELAVHIISIIISFVLGLLPGLDNFSHIGGMLTGLVLGISIMHSPDRLRARIGESYSPVAYGDPKSVGVSSSATGGGFAAFRRSPAGFFRGRKPLWWLWWLVRAGTLVGIVVGFIVLLNNFYQHQNDCHWCKYISCLVSNVSFTAPFRSFLTSYSLLGTGAIWEPLALVRKRQPRPHRPIRTRPALCSASERYIGSSFI